MEKLNLTKEFVVDPRKTDEFELDALLLNWKDKRFVVWLGNVNGVQQMVEYVNLPERPDPDNPKQTLPADPAATNFMNYVNKLTGNSLHRIVFEQLLTDGKVEGSITGTPD